MTIATMNASPGRPLTRRSFLRVAAGSAAGLVAAPALVSSAEGPRWKDNPFSLGVASGAPSSDGFVLWTRLAPEPTSTDPDAPGGMTGPDLPVAYEIAADPAMREIVQRGTATAEATYAHSVHADIKGLMPGRPYWYRFASADARSRIGRAMTLPAPGSRPERLRFAVVSCSNYEHGYFSGYRHAAGEEPDVVLFLGDYIYEYVDRRPGLVRRHSEGVDATTLPTYRNRYAQYQLDADLQRLHAASTALVTWDDHEVQNDYAGEWSVTFDDPERFLLRRAAAYQAFYESLPMRPGLSRPNGPAMRIHDRFAFGDLAEISMIDGRQYRSREACYGPPDKGGGHLETNAGCPERLDAQRSMIGLAQEAWLMDGLARSQARWSFIAQDVLMAQLRQKNEVGEIAHWTDGWDGYPASRTRLIRHIHDRRVKNPVVLSGDIHSYWTNDLKLDFDDPGSPTVAAELVGTSISARGPPYERFFKALPDNPHVRYFESRRRGYVSVDLTPGLMTARLQAISAASDPAATVSTLKTFVVEDGRPGAVEA